MNAGPSDRRKSSFRRFSPDRFPSQPEATPGLFFFIRASMEAEKLGYPQVDIRSSIVLSPPHSTRHVRGPGSRGMTIRTMHQELLIVVAGWVRSACLALFSTANSTRSDHESNSFWRGRPSI